MYVRCKYYKIGKKKLLAKFDKNVTVTFKAPPGEKRSGRSDVEPAAGRFTVHHNYITYIYFKPR